MMTCKKKLPVSNYGYKISRIDIDVSVHIAMASEVLAKSPHMLNIH